MTQVRTKRTAPAWRFGTRSRADPPHQCRPSAPIWLTLRVVLPPLGHPEAAEPHVPEDERALWREEAAQPDETCVSPPSVTVVEGGSEAPRSFVSALICESGHSGMRKCNSEVWSQGRFHARHLRGHFPAGISQQPKSSINKAKRPAVGCKAARPITDPIS